MIIIIADVMNTLPVRIYCKKVICPNIYFFNYTYISGCSASLKLETVYIILIIIKALAGITMLLKLFIFPANYNIRYRLHTLSMENDKKIIKIKGSTMLMTRTFSVLSDIAITFLILLGPIGESI